MSGFTADHLDWQIVFLLAVALAELEGIRYRVFRHPAMGWDFEPVGAR